SPDGGKLPLHPSSLIPRSNPHIQQGRIAFSCDMTMTDPPRSTTPRPKSRGLGPVLAGEPASRSHGHIRMSVAIRGLLGRAAQQAHLLDQSSGQFALAGLAVVVLVVALEVIQQRADARRAEFPDPLGDLRGQFPPASGQPFLEFGSPEPVMDGPS